MNDPIASLKAVTKRYGPLEVVKNLSLEVRAGECVGLLGPNGAGKTTSLKMITGEAYRSGGEINLFGIPVDRSPRKVRARIGVVTQDDTLDEELTAFENLFVFAGYFGVGAREAAKRAEELLDFVVLSAKRDERVPALSGGMRRRLLIARALVAAPELLILDEPTTGLDPQARRLIWQKLRLLKRQGVTMLLTTHYMEEAEQLCDRVLLMELGKVVAEGTPQALTQKHIGQEVVELRSTELSPQELRRELSLNGLETEIAADTLYVLLPSGGQVPPELRGLENVDFLHRRATLEDVFLKLTGKDLRE